MRHALVEGWALRSSFIHSLHPSAKIICATAFLIAISTTHQRAPVVCLTYLLLLLSLTAVANLPAKGLLASAAAAVLPFAFAFALVSLIAGDPDRALLLLLRAFTSSYVALFLIATTPMPRLIAGLEYFHGPRFLLLVMDFLYRYLVVLFEEAAAIRDAGASRGGTLRSFQLKQASAAAGVLFRRSYNRANAIHQAMIARGFTGSIPMLSRPALRSVDVFATLAVMLTVVGTRILFT